VKDLQLAVDALVIGSARASQRVEDLKTELDHEREARAMVTRAAVKLLASQPKLLEEAVTLRAASLEDLREREREIVTRGAELDSGEAQLREAVEHHAGRLDGVREDEARLEVRAADLVKAESAAAAALRLYDKTSEEILADVTEAVREEESARAGATIAGAQARLDLQLAEGEARVAKAIAKAEGAKISELQGLANRLASDLVDLNPGLDVLVDYLTVTGQLTGKSRRKDCTDDQLAKIRKAHSL